MAKMTINEGVFELTHQVTGVGTFTDLINTQNTFVDKNISIKVTVPAAGSKTLAITDKSSTTITVGTASGGYYPLTTSLEGTMTFSSAGWITTDGQTATDSSVTVGRIAQSTLKNGTTTISSGSTIYPNPTSTQTINIGAGHYNSERTVIIGAMSGGTKAAATVTISGTATTPTLVNTVSAINQKTQISINNNNISNDASDISTKYYLALTAATTGVTNANLTINKNVTTAGYLGPTGTTTQISSSGSINGSNNLYYLPINTAEISIGGNSTTLGNITLSKYNEDGSNNGVNINSNLLSSSNPTTNEPTSGNYIAIQIQTPVANISPTVSITTPGWVGENTEISAYNVTTNSKTVQAYIPIKTGALAAGAGVANASSGNITLGTKTTTQPSSGKYITVTGSGSVSVGTAGYLSTSTAAQSSNTATAYYPIATATFIAAGGKIKSSTAGWIDANVEVGDVGTGSLAQTATSGQTYTEVNTPSILTSDGYLYINKGYFANTKISLGTLIPDSATDDVVSGAMLEGYEAFDTDGHRIVGGISTYDGDYTTSSGWTTA